MRNMLTFLVLIIKSPCMLTTEKWEHSINLGISISATIMIYVDIPVLEQRTWHNLNEYDTDE